MFKKIITTITVFLVATNANSYSGSLYAVNDSTNFKMEYNGDSLDLTGYAFPQELTIVKRKNLYQLSNKNIVDAVRNIITAYRDKNTQWLKQHSIGKPSIFDYHYKKYSSLFENYDYSLQGYILYHKYAIALLKEDGNKKNMIYVMEKDSNHEYKIALDFKYLHPKQFEIIENSFNNKGVFDISKAK